MMFKLGEVIGWLLALVVFSVKFAVYATVNPVTQIVVMWVWLPTFWWLDVIGGLIPFWMPVRFLTYWTTGL